MLENVNLINNVLRTILTMADYGVYSLLKYVYQLFFNVASTNLLGGEMVYNIFGRVQLVLGVFMMFKLTMSIIKGIVNPDTFTDGKTGFGNIIMRIMISLVLLTLIVPLNIQSPKNKYELHINNSGILFGTMYSLQERLLENNTLGKLIFGSSSENYTSKNTPNLYTKLERVSNTFSSTVLKSFYKLKTDDNNTFICSSFTDGGGLEPQTVVDYYSLDYPDPTVIIYMAQTLKCQSNSGGSGIIGAIGRLIEINTVLPPGTVSSIGSEYAFSITPIISTIVGIILIWLMFKITFDVAVRVFKLMALQLIAPIPIISYIDPNNGKDGMFNSWVKLLTSTYLELFLHLGVIYFVMSMISTLMKNIGSIIIINGLSEELTVKNSILLEWTIIVLIIGLLIFAKNAPKFFKQALGIKSDGKFFTAFGSELGIGKGTVAVGAGLASGAATGWRGNEESQKARWLSEHGTMEGFKVNRGSQIAAALFRGGISGGTAGRAVYQDKEHRLSSGLNASYRSNSAYAGYASEGASLGGKIGAYAQRALTGETRYDQLERDLKAREEKNKYDEKVNSYRKAIMDRAKSKGVESLETSGTITATSGTLGKYNGFTANAAEFRSWAASVASGDNVYKKYVKVDGTQISESTYNSMSDADKATVSVGTYAKYKGTEINTEDVGVLRTEIDDKNIANYAEKALSGSISDTDISSANARFKDATGKNVESTFGGSTGLKASYGDESHRIEEENRKITEARKKNQANKANSDATKPSGK